MTGQKKRRIPTLDEIHARCADDGGCLIWQGGTNGHGHCKISDMSGRRMVWTLAHGPLKSSQLIRVACGNPRCLNPEHLSITNKSEVSRIAGAQSATRAKRVASLERTKRASAKITMEIARTIRSDPRMGFELADEFGVSKTTVSRIRRHLAWKERSMFDGLGARASNDGNRRAA